MPDDESNSASPALTPLSQPGSLWLSSSPWLDPPQLGVFCETPNGTFLKLPSLGTHIDTLVRDYCHKATLDYLAKQRLELILPFHPNVLESSITNVNLDKFPRYDGFTFKTPGLVLGKFDVAAIFSVKPALSIGNSSLTAAGASLDYHLSPRFQISATGSFGQTSTDPYGGKITTQQGLGVTIILKKKF